ncbi:mif2/CENP-C like domain-containing protein [Hirsutella rhossiliensis]|uniref:CENP-C homolog n=1 Tax=Hirsutella rhossiliensis TaxID=111463 RepID=A0A9P8N4V1_9HYPO|nr:mif2/CENP-C like domain-containing protein [Hirsutella rhossiliensis]KAH0966960.1 mif2/CENP-C like domain-containing protein [Hirsutella rhossiliensis]
MAPRARRGEASEPQAFHELGVRGRKTGVFLPDGGERDEHGMQPLEAIFSSPQKAAASANGGADDSGSEDMDIASSAGPGPRTLLKNQRDIKYPIPRSRSPLKTNLNSAARKNPHIERLSSPARGSVGAEDRDATVTRRLDFNARAAKSKLGGANGKLNGVNGSTRDIAEEDSILSGHADLDVGDMVEESLQMIDAMSGGSDDHDDEPEPPQPSISEDLAEEEQEEDEPPVRRGRGRPQREDRQKQGTQKSQPAKKRRSLRNSTGGDGVDGAEQEQGAEADDDDEPRQPKRQRTQGPVAPKASAAAKTSNSAKAPVTAKTTAEAQAKADNNKPKPRGRLGRKAKERGAEEETGEASFMALQRGPPMPKSRGLVSVRRDADGVTQTRSGRHSYRPVAYWRGEQVIREDEEQSDMFHGGDFVLPSIKEVTRAKATAGSGSKQAVDDDEELEEWEMNPGTVTGEIVLWEPEHEEHPPADDEPVQVMDDRVAISADAIQTSDIKDATFRFAKTLTMPFMGAGVVDLPPGSEKRPKNSRKMHMVFFVHYGKVLVTINEAQFRISAGGMWFVPRGNYYSITNDYDNPARIFFSQACEIQAPQPNESPEQSTMALGY